MCNSQILTYLALTHGVSTVVMPAGMDSSTDLVTLNGSSEGSKGEIQNQGFLNQEACYEYDISIVCLVGVREQAKRNEQFESGFN